MMGSSRPSTLNYLTNSNILPLMGMNMYENNKNSFDNVFQELI